MLRHTSIHTYAIPEETNPLSGYVVCVCVCVCVCVGRTWLDTSVKHTSRLLAEEPAATLFNTSARCAQTLLPFPCSFCSGCFCQSRAPVTDTLTVSSRHISLPAGENPFWTRTHTHKQFAFFCFEAWFVLTTSNLADANTHKLRTGKQACQLLTGTTNTNTGVRGANSESAHPRRRTQGGKFVCAFVETFET